LLANLDLVIAARHFDQQHSEGKSRITPLDGSIGTIDPQQNAKQSVKHVHVCEWTSPRDLSNQLALPGP
jgi:hypothetical protein